MKQRKTLNLTQNDVQAMAENLKMAHPQLDREDFKAKLVHEVRGKLELKSGVRMPKKPNSWIEAAALALFDGIERKFEGFKAQPLSIIPNHKNHSRAASAALAA